MPLFVPATIRRLLLLLVLAGLGAAAVQSWRLALWRARAEAAETRLAAWAEAARLRAVQDRRLAELRGAAARLDHDLAMGEGADAPLSDYLRGAAGRLWP